MTRGGQGAPGAATCILHQRSPHRVAPALPAVPEIGICGLQSPAATAALLPRAPITVVSSTPLSDIIHNREATRRVAKWGVEIGVHNIRYEPHKAVKS